jgi:ABC-type sugar transport system permease subunit
LIAFGTTLGRVPRRLTGLIDRLGDRSFAFLAFLPGGLLILLFIIPPILAVLGMSFLRIELLRDDEIRFVGLHNYVNRLPADSAFLESVPRTIALAGGTTLLTVPLALAAALMLNRAFRGSTLLGIALLLPWAVAPVVTGLYWKFIFQSQFGLATAVANAVGLADGPVRWLESTSSALGVAIVAHAWRMVPLMALLILGALRTVPEAHYRAATMDGANAWQRFRAITLPAIAPTMVVVSAMTVILSLQLIDILFQLTGGGPGNATTVMVYYLYKNTIQQLSFGYSGALAVFFFAVVLVCSLVLLAWQYRARRRRAPGLIEATDDDLSAPPLRGRLSERLQELPPLAPPVRRFRLPRMVVGAGIGMATLAMTVWLVGPIVWIAITSLQPEGAVTQLPYQFTLDLRFDHYADLLTDPNRGWLRSMWVSIQVVVLVTAITATLAALAAYPLARLELPGKRPLMAILIFTQMVPSIVLVIPVFLMFRLIGLKDSVFALVLINVAYWMPLIIWLMRNVLKEVPRSIESAARLDGCGRLGTLFRILLPAARPGLAAVVILMLIGTWNEFLFAVILGDREAVTVTRLIGFIDSAAGPDGPPPYTIAAAAGITAFLPCLLLVVVFYRRLVAGLSEGYVKG